MSCRYLHHLFMVHGDRTQLMVISHAHTSHLGVVLEFKYYTIV